MNYNKLNFHQVQSIDPQFRRKLKRLAQNGWTLRVQYIKCGKKGCGCKTTNGHGPYWYAFRKIAATTSTSPNATKTVSKYIGKEPEEHEE